LSKTASVFYELPHGRLIRGGKSGIDVTLVVGRDFFRRADAGFVGGANDAEQSQLRREMLRGSTVEGPVRQRIFKTMT
jgi:hypothetical protein